MSKYTTEVRFICESYTQNINSFNIDEILNECWEKIFYTKVMFFDESYKNILCKKILKHFYFREICCETVGLWKIWMNTKLEEIMPYYNELYKSALLKFDPLIDVDMNIKKNRTTDGTTKEDKNNNETTSTVKDSQGNTTNNINRNETTNTVNTTDQTNYNLYSDTPQGDLNGLEDKKYLTNARKTTDELNNSINKEGNNTENSSTEYNENNTINENINATYTATGATKTIDDYIEKISGKRGNKTYSSMLYEFRKSILNIDLMVIEEFNDLFFNLW